MTAPADRCRLETRASSPIGSDRQAFYVAGFPTAFIMLIAVAIPMAAMLLLTPSGNRVVATGSNLQAAKLSGIAIRRVRTQVVSGDRKRGRFFGRPIWSNVAHVHSVSPADAAADEVR